MLKSSHQWNKTSQSRVTAFSPASSSQIPLAPWGCCRSSSPSAQQNLQKTSRKPLKALETPEIETYPQHLDVNDLVHVLLTVILVPDEDLGRLVRLWALEALRQEGLIQTPGFGVSHLLDTLNRRRRWLVVSIAPLWPRPHLQDWGCPSYLHLLLGPLVQVNRLDLGYVDPQVPVDASTADADEDSQIPGGPSGTWRKEKEGWCGWVKMLGSGEHARWGHQIQAKDLIQSF